MLHHPAHFYGAELDTVARVLGPKAAGLVKLAEHADRIGFEVPPFRILDCCACDAYCEDVEAGGLIYPLLPHAHEIPSHARQIAERHAMQLVCMLRLSHFPVLRTSLVWASKSERLPGIDTTRICSGPNDRLRALENTLCGLYKAYTDLCFRTAGIVGRRRASIVMMAAVSASFEGLAYVVDGMVYAELVCTTSGRRLHVSHGSSWPERIGGLRSQPLIAALKDVASAGESFACEIEFLVGRDSELWIIQRTPVAHEGPTGYFHSESSISGEILDLRGMSRQMPIVDLRAELVGSAGKVVVVPSIHPTALDAFSFWWACDSLGIRPAAAALLLVRQSRSTLGMTTHIRRALASCFPGTATLSFDPQDIPAGLRALRVESDGIAAHLEAL